MAKVSIYTQNVMAPPLNVQKLAEWIDTVAHRHGRVAGQLTYVFSDDEYILETNRKFLGHDYYTDVITFDYSNARRIAGDMVISLDTVASNAQMLGVRESQELLRVVIHGVLHLCGINDKAPGEREIMEKNENEALACCPDNVLEA